MRGHAVDVEVKDHKGVAVHGLKAADSTLRKAGGARQATTFEEHSAAAQGAATTPAPKLPAGEFTNYIAVPQSNVLNVILYDTTNTAMTNQAHMRKQPVALLKRGADSSTGSKSPLPQ